MGLPPHEAGVHIVLVEDDEPLGAAIQTALERLSYTVTWLRDGRTALLAIRDQTADIVLLDLGLPGMDGLEVLSAARQANIQTPILVMTARDALESRIRGLDAGADDYLIKPFYMGELSARIRSLTRRAQGLAANRIVVGAIAIDIGNSSVEFRGQQVELTRKEFALLHLLMERAGRIVRRDQLENSLYGLDKEVSSNALEVLIHSLRRKLNHDTIRNVRGFGYMVPGDPT
jgi:two-component system response regulator QseB